MSPMNSVPLSLE